MKRKSILVLAIILMSIGFASVSTILYLNGQTFVAGNTTDFDVYFSKAYENGVENNVLIQDKTHIVFTTELKKIDEEYVLDYEVTNASKQYDTNVVMNCIGGNEYLRVTNEFETNEILPARTIRPGKLTLTVLKEVVEEIRVEVSCEIKGTAQERTSVGSEEFILEKPATAVESLIEKINSKSVTTYTDGNIHEMYAFEHAKTEQMPANTDYRYIGNDPYNYVRFNCTNYETQSGCEMWRIIGLMPDEEGIYRLKLIRENFVDNLAFDDNANNYWVTSTIKKMMEGLVNQITQERYIEDAIFYLGTGSASSNSADYIYNFERSNKNNNSRLVNIRNKVGLMYISDFYLTFGKEVNNRCYNDAVDCSSYGKPNLSWLYNNTKTQWTITYRDSNDSQTYHINSYGQISFSMAYIKNSARPVVYLKPEIEFKQGDYDGSKEKPYELKELE